MTVDGGSPQTIALTANCDTAANSAAAITVTGATVAEVDGVIVITSDSTGSSSSVEVDASSDTNAKALFGVGVAVVGSAARVRITSGGAAGPSSTIAIDASSGSNAKALFGDAPVVVDGADDCVLCPANTDSSARSNQLSDCTCNAGYYDGDGSVNDQAVVCEACPAGLYNQYSARYSLSHCIECSAGRYGEDIASTSSSLCFECPLNSNSPAQSALLRNCTCNVGYYDTDGATVDDSVTCAGCLAGFYNDQIAQVACTACPRGTYNPSAARPSLNDCIDCALGTYNTDLSGTTIGDCTACPSDSTSGKGSVQMSDCSCDAGYEESDGSFEDQNLACEPCAAGYRRDTCMANFHKFDPGGSNTAWAMHCFTSGCPVKPVAVATGTYDRMSMAGLSGGVDKWMGGVLAGNGNIYLAPYNAEEVLIIDPVTDTYDRTTMVGLSGSLKWVGGVLAGNGKIYLAPYNAEEVLIIDPVTDTYDRTTMVGLTGSGKWMGGVLAENGKIYLAPRNAEMVLIIDPATDTYDRTTMVGLSGSGKWMGGVLAENGKIYLAPYKAEEVLIIDPATDTYDRTTMVGLGVSFKWSGGVLGGNGKIYLTPRGIEEVLIIDPATDTYDRTTMVGLTGSDKWMGAGVLAGNGKIYLAPYKAEEVLIIDPATDTYDRTTMVGLSGSGEWGGGVLGGNGKIYLAPRDAEEVLIVHTNPVNSLVLPECDARCDSMSCVGDECDGGNCCSGCKAHCRDGCAEFVRLYTTMSTVTACAACAVGFYQDGTASAQCIACPVGQSTLGKNTTLNASDGGCVCSAGYYGGNSSEHRSHGTYTGASFTASNFSAAPEDLIVTVDSGSPQTIALTANCDTAANSAAAIIVTGATVAEVDGAIVIISDSTGSSSSVEVDASSGTNAKALFGAGVAVAGSTTVVWAACTACPLGRYKSSAGNVAEPDDACMECGEFTRTNSVGASECTCEENFERAAGSDDCVVVGCVAGSAANSDGSPGCTSCSPGRYNPEHGDGTCIVCSGGSVTDTLEQAGGTSCTPCMAGRYGAVSTVNCTNCVAGKYVAVAGSNDASDCIDCVAGTFVALAGSDASLDCVDCAAGKYVDGDGERRGVGLHRLRCGASTWTVAGSDEVSANCIDCVAGKYESVPGSANMDCTDCPAGRYVSDTGSNDPWLCLGCPMEST